jgi:hypothetical protein
VTVELKQRVVFLKKNGFGGKIEGWGYRYQMGKIAARKIGRDSKI